MKNKKTVAKKPLISVILPVYNAEKYIEESVNSILLQSFKKFELIIINDASTDKTLSILHKLKKKDKRIILINNKTNLQMSKSLNLGIDKARANIIARMDQDDIALNKRLEIQYKFLKFNPKVAIVGNDILIIDKQGNVTGKRTYPTKSNQLKKVIFRYSPFAHPSVMFRKKAFFEVGGYDPTKDPCEDIDFWFRLGRKYEFASIPTFLLKYRLLAISSSHHNVLNTEIVGFKIKLNAIKNYGFKLSLFDVVYNSLQFITAWFMPASVRIWLYNMLRSRNII